jgi:hypothetical protein
MLETSNKTTGVENLQLWNDTALGRILSGMQIIFRTETVKRSNIPPIIFLTVFEKIISLTET